ncbi:MAG: helix-turn-helix domain-containing protein [Leptolyngbyaceae bacterium]|nr:helix-turn-helix domain-containing protein [Leptolyngbyaceae bacterium]
MTYQHLSHHERYQIAALMKAGQNQTQIAAILGRHKSTVSREIHRNTELRGYRPRQASQLAVMQEARVRALPRQLRQRH